MWQRAYRPAWVRRAAVKLGFSTLGCPDWSLGDIVAKGRAYGFDGVGLRAIGGELNLLRVPDLAPARLAESRAIFGKRFQAAMILTSVRLVPPVEEIEDNLAVAESHIDIAAALGAPAIRVFGGQMAVGLARQAAIVRAAERLRRLGDYAMSRGVDVLLETHDDFTDPCLVRQVMQAAHHPRVGVVWDMHHTFRLREALPEAAWAAIAPWVRSVDVKDSVTDLTAPLGYSYVPVGEGDVPVRKTIELLKAKGYEGWLSFEWERRWHPELAAAEVVFPSFIATMREWL